MPELTGSWCWFQGPRAIFSRGWMIFGYVGEDGGIHAVMENPETGALRDFTLSTLSADDHNAPVFLELTDGRILAMYAGHNYDSLSRYRLYDGSEFSPEMIFDWASAGVEGGVTYSNLFHLSSTGLVYNISRVGRNHHIIRSHNGTDWNYCGQVNTGDGTGYVDGYFKFSSNGIDRIHYLAVPHHPRDFNNSVYYGEILAENSVLPRVISELRCIYPANTGIPGGRLTHLWLNDFRIYDDGVMAAVIQGRLNGWKRSHFLVHLVTVQGEWRLCTLQNAGSVLFSSEEDYVAGAVLDPRDPLKMICPAGKVRPIAVSGEDRTVVLWLQGKMRSSQKCRMKIGWEEI